MTKAVEALSSSDKAQLGGVVESLGFPSVVASRSVLASTTLPVAPRIVNEAGREGLFVWDATVPVEAHQADATTRGYYVTGFPTIIGAYRRVEKELRSKWFDLDAVNGTDNQAKIQSMLDTYNQGSFTRLIFEGRGNLRVGRHPTDKSTCLSLLLSTAREHLVEFPEGVRLLFDNAVPETVDTGSAEYTPRFHNFRVLNKSTVNGGSNGGGSVRIINPRMRLTRQSTRRSSVYMLYVGGFEDEVDIQFPEILVADNHGIVVGPNSGTKVLQKLTINRAKIGTLDPLFGQALNGNYGAVGDTGIWIAGGCKDVDIASPVVRATGDDAIFVGHSASVDSASVRITDADVAFCAGGLKIALSKGRITGTVDRTRAHAVTAMAYGANRPEDIFLDVHTREAGMLAVGDIGTSMIGTENAAAGFLINTDGSGFTVRGRVDISERYGVVIRSGGWEGTGVAAGYMRNLSVDVQLDRIGYASYNRTTGALGAVTGSSRGFAYDGVTAGAPLINADIRLNLGTLECPAFAISSTGPSGTKVSNVTVTLTGKAPEVATANEVNNVKYIGRLTRGSATTADATPAFEAITVIDNTVPPALFALPMNIGTNTDAPAVNYISRRVQVRKSFASTGSAMVVPQGYRCINILLRNTSANAVTSGINIGSASGGTDVGGNVALAANEIKRLDTGQLTIRPGSMTAATNIFFGSSNWGGSTVDIELVCERIDWK